MEREHEMDKENKQKLVIFMLIFGLFFKIYLTRILVFNDYNILNLFTKETWAVLLFLLIVVLAKNTKRERNIYLIFNFAFSLVLLTIITYYD